MDAGLGHRLMRDYWVGGGHDDGDIHLVCPATPGYEQKMAQFFPSDGCTFQRTDGLCELHDLGLKPIEGRLALCGERTPKDMHFEVAQLWNNPEAQELALALVPLEY